MLFKCLYSQKNKVTKLFNRFLVCMYTIQDLCSAKIYNYCPPRQCICMCRVHTSTHIFSRMLKAGNCWQRSSLNNVAKCLDRCWPEEHNYYYFLWIYSIFLSTQCIHTYGIMHTDTRKHYLPAPDKMAQIMACFREASLSSGWMAGS